MNIYKFDFGDEEDLIIISSKCKQGMYSLFLAYNIANETGDYIGSFTSFLESRLVKFKSFDKSAISMKYNKKDKSVTMQVLNE